MTPSAARQSTDKFHMTQNDRAIRQRTFQSSSPATTRALGQQLGRILDGGEVIGLVGDLGSGKTTFTKGLSEGLGFGDPRQVCSPTYVLEHIYQARLRIHHYDAYRLDSADEFLALGFEEQLTDNDAVLVVEWADRVANVLPQNGLKIEFLFSGPSASGDVRGSAEHEHRELVFSGPEIFWSSRLDDLKFRPSRGG